MPLPRHALTGAVAIAAVSFYHKVWGIQLLHEAGALQEQLHGLSARQTGEPVIRFIGRAFFFLATAAWLVLSTQSVVVAIQRARYKPKVKQPLQPLSEEDAQQQQKEQQAAAAKQQAGSSSSAAAAAPRAAPTKPRQSAADAAAASTKRAKAAPAAAVPAAAARSSSAQPSKEQQERDWRDERRRKALEAAQRALDEQAAVLRAQQEQQEAERQARKAQAAEEAARQQAAQAAAQAAARAAALSEAEARAAAAAAEEARRRDVWLAAVQNQWHRVTTEQSQQQHPAAAAQPAPTAAASGSPAATVAAAANWDPDDLYADDHFAPTNAPAAAATADRRIVAEQDSEYQQSLERDRIKAAERAARRAAERREQAQQQQLAALRQAAQHKLPPEPPSGVDGALALRVRLPGGGQASRRFRAEQGFEDVFAWVYSLPEMPLWAPGSWTLISAFPRRQLAPPSDSSWAPGAWQVQGSAAGAADVEDVLLPGEWMLQVNRLTEAPLWVKVHADMTLQEVQAELEQQTGAEPEQQRLIFGGQILSHFPHRSMAQLSISQGHVLQLAVRESGAGSSDGGSGGGSSSSATAAAGVTAAAAAAGVERDASLSERAQELAKAADHAYLGGGDVLVLSSVGELQAEVAGGAPLLALYVEALPSVLSS